MLDVRVPIFLVLAAALFLGGCCGPRASLHIAAYQAPSHATSYGLRFVEWRPMPGRFTSSGDFEELRALGPVTLTCRDPATCSVTGESVAIHADRSGAMPAQVEVVVTVAGFAPATVAIPTNDLRERIVLLEPEAKP